jgi:TonB family protein
MSSSVAARQSGSRLRMLAWAGALALVTLPAAALFARQAPSAPLTGTVFDVTGGVIPGVEVTIVDARQIKTMVTSNANGRFEFPAIAPGRYVIEANLPGFRPLHNEMELRAARDFDRALMLQIGEMQETISIRSTRAASGAQQPASGPVAPVRVGGSVRVPHKIVDVAPVYPATMRAAGLTGVVPIEAIIGRDGSVSSVRVLSAQVHPDLAISAADAVRKWRYSPTLLNGVPVEVVMTVTIRFELSEG